MGYRIEYTDGIGKRRRRFKRKKGIIPGVCILLLLAALLHPRARSVVRDTLLPGDEAVTVQALEGLVLDLREGEDLSRAVSSFCTFVMEESGA